MPRMLTRPKPLVSATTPGVVMAKADQRRLLMGMFWIACWLRVLLKSGDSRFITGVTSVTSTVAEDDETARCGSRLVTWPTTTSTSSARHAAKPDEVTETV